MKCPQFGNIGGSDITDPYFQCYYYDDQAKNAGNELLRRKCLVIIVWCCLSHRLALSTVFIQKLATLSEKALLCSGLRQRNPLPPEATPRAESEFRAAVQRPEPGNHPQILHNLWNNSGERAVNKLERPIQHYRCQGGPSARLMLMLADWSGYTLGSSCFPIVYTYSFCSDFLLELHSMSIRRQ